MNAPHSIRRRIAVTGAFGYSGRYIAQRLLNQGGEVITLTNSPNRQNSFPPNRARGTIAGTSDVLLRGPSLFDEIDPGVRLGHRIAQRLLCQDNAGHEPHTMFILRPD